MRLLCDESSALDKLKAVREGPGGKKGSSRAGRRPMSAFYWFVFYSTWLFNCFLEGLNWNIMHFLCKLVSGWVFLANLWKRRYLYHKKLCIFALGKCTIWSCWFDYWNEGLLIWIVIYIACSSIAKNLWYWYINFKRLEFGTCLNRSEYYFTLLATH